MVRVKGLGHEGQSRTPVPEVVIDLTSLTNPCGEGGSVEFHGRKGAGGGNGRLLGLFAGSEKSDFLTCEGGKWEEGEMTTRGWR